MSDDWLLRYVERRSFCCSFDILFLIFFFFLNHARYYTVVSMDIVATLFYFDNFHCEKFANSKNGTIYSLSTGEMTLSEIIYAFIAKT